MTLTPEDARLLSEVRGWGDRASNAERRLVAMVDGLAARLASAEAMLRAVLKWFASDAERQYVTGAMLQARVETTLNAEHFDPDRRERSSPLPPLVEDCSTGTPKMVPAPEPPAQYVMPPRCTAMREEVRCASAAGHPWYHANADLSVTWIDSVKTEAERMAREVQAENDYIAGPLSDWNSQPAHVCAHPGVMRRCEWLTSSGGVPARIYCQSCDQTLYPPAATPAVPTPIDPVRDVIGDYRCGVDGCTANVRRPGDRCVSHSISHEGVGRLKDGPAPKVIYTRQEFDALLEGLRERCMSAASEAQSRFAAASVAVVNVPLWPVTEPERKE